jgi:hypothetical protein
VSADLKPVFRGDLISSLREDDEFVEAAFADWKQQRGYHAGIRVGDIDRKSLSEVLQRAQTLKVRARETTA